ncbi:hypothetical protein K443DRAFT_135548 [Laccaria amethystina LaAM-08-1]|uniref:Uncharacterized protein n=1 Tax=Laccaria amethystina LaAM-08-1 TaxID=1095629 RepID=A0A0C9WMK2_9AGAR|nr:hypothetical protein K443DRAFT_135548 [Laccaria amethystina LaAM-08-1]
MTRRKWTTDEQEAWLEQRKAAFIEANQKKTAAKDFYPIVTKEFCEKWPMPPVTQQEVDNAGSIELATRVKQGKYDKCICGWFPNNTRNVAPGSLGILKIERKPQPRILQPWQAYQALTYESRWKPEVDAAWSTYKNVWLTEHPEEKPPKNRFQIMIEFIKEKFEKETDEVKSQCEEYRKTRQVEAATPDPDKPDSVKNTKFQEAIDMLPRTLTTIGESLMSQTGWNVSILMGGPTPDSDGVIMTYLSHTGKTKDGETFEKFIGNKDYDEKLLLPFEAFLNASFCKYPDKVETAKLTLFIAEEDCAARSLKSKEKADASGDDSPNAAVAGKSQYEINKERNMKEIKQRLAELEEQYPLPKEFAQKKLPKAPAVKKGKQGRNETVVRRESQRGKDKIAVSAVSQEVTLTTTKLAPTTVEAPQATSDTAARPAPSTVLLNTQTPAEKSSPTVGVIHSSPSHADPTASISAINPASAPSYDAPDAALAKPPITDIGLASELTAVGGEQPHQDKGNDDVVMSNSPPLVQKPQNDVNMPPWLIPMINYLRGKLPTRCRPQEVADWMRSKKKDVVPPVKPAQFGKQFLEWWTVIQPDWRKDDIEGSLMFFRDVPIGETWQGMRKGGTAGIYIVVMALSWWIKAQKGKRDVVAWSTIDDLLWVIQQLNQNTVSYITVPKKRAHDEKDGSEDEGQRKSRRLSG